MKIHAALIIPFLLVAGCASFTVEIKEDPFKGTTMVRADMWHTVLDSNFDNTRVLYEKTITDGVAADPVVTFEFVAVMDPYYNYYGEPLQPGGYVLVRSKSYPVELFDMYKMRYGHPAVAGGYLWWGPSPWWGFPYYYPYPGMVIIRSDIRYVLKAKMRLTPELQQAIAASDFYQIRLYAGDTPVTLEATPKQLEAVKKFLATSTASAEKK